LNFTKLSTALARLKGMEPEARPLDAPLPDDLALCQTMIRELLTTLHERTQELDGVRQRLDQLLRRLYGPKAERFDPNQPTLFDGLTPPAPPEPAAPPPVAPVPEPTTPAQRKGHGRRRLPAHLPRQRQEHELSPAEQICPCCQQPRVKIGEETSEQLDYRPASLFIIEHVRFKYACLACLKKNETSTAPVEPTPEPLLVTAPKPAAPIEKGLPGPGLMAHIIVSKYVDHLPLHRQESILARQGVALSRSTMCDWMAAAANLLLPLYRLLVERVLLGQVLHTDDTKVPVLEPDHKRTKSGRLWVYLGDRDHPGVVFDYTPTHARDGPQTFLKTYKGYLQADAFSAYDGIYAPGGIIEVACWAHARRHFFDARTSDAARAHEALARIRALYAVEDEAKAQITAGQLEDAAADAWRLRLRQEKSQPLLVAFESWLRAQQTQVLPKSPFAQAIGYALRQWTALNCFCAQGFLNIDNNAAERALRGIAVGRRNWLFAGSDQGAKTAAVLYSMVGTCKHLGIDPFTYLRDVLARLPDLPIDRHADLLPDHWAAAQRAAADPPS
jgi:transposase